MKKEVLTRHKQKRLGKNALRQAEPWQSENALNIGASY